jgi:hypothetical protein
MKKVITILSFYFLCSSLFAQPANFSWRDRHGKTGIYSYISNAEDQKIQGPCMIFASVAAVEAMTHIYYNMMDASTFNLSEANLYNNDCGLGCEGAYLGVDASLEFIRDSGIVDETIFPFPSTSPYCAGSCENKYDNANYIVSIPYFTELTGINNNTDLKKAIMDYGPIIMLSSVETGTKIGEVLHPSDQDNEHNHTVLVLGWQSNPGLEWHIKDSWPGAPSIEYKAVNFFNFNPTFYRVWTRTETSQINCSIYESINYEDEDGDGFFNWGLDTDPKPEGCPGPDLMDFNDSVATIIYREGYNDGLVAPTLTAGPSYLCASGFTYVLNNVPSVFSDSVTWAVTPANCVTPSSGSGNTASITPTYMGKQCTITFTMRHNGAVTYSEQFITNGPLESQVSVSVQDAYGGSPPKYGDIYYLCPNTTYYIYYNNSDGNCTTSDFDWDLPYGWTEYWSSNNSVAINTNNYPDGQLDIYAKTSCCSPQSRVKVFTQYFDQAECGEFFMAFPNPSEQYVDIDIIEKKLTDEEINTNTECSLTLFDKSGIIKYKTKFKGFPHRMNTQNLPNGIYFINLDMEGKNSTIQLVVEH